MSELRVLIADDQLHVRTILKVRIKDSLSGYYVPIEFDMAATATEAVALAQESHKSGLPYDFITLDINFAPTEDNAPDGHWASSQIRKILPDVTIVIVSSFPNFENLTKAEGNDAITRFFSRDEFTDNELFRMVLFSLLRKLHRDQSLLPSDKTIFTQSPKMYEYLNRLDQVNCELNVMIYGETGTGKELSARRLHANAQYELKQEARPFVAINCGAIPEDLIESELFGHMKGSFTGATSNKEGLLSQANGGDLFFDEIQNASPRFQKAVMRSIQERNFRPVGSNQIHEFNCRIISALNVDPSTAKESGQLMKDFVARLNNEYLSIPSLAERPEDHKLLIDLVLDQNKEQHKTFSSESIVYLKTLSWPENIRSYLAVIKSAITHSKTPIIGVGTLTSLPILKESKTTTSYKIEVDPRADLIQTLVDAAMSRNTSLTALIDDVERQFLLSSIKNYGCRNAAELQKVIDVPYTSLKRRLKALKITF